MVGTASQNVPGTEEPVSNSNRLIEQASRSFPGIVGGAQGALRMQLGIAVALVKGSSSVVLEFTSYFFFLTYALYGFTMRFEARNSFGYFAYILVIVKPLGAFYDFAMKNKKRYVGFPPAPRNHSIKYIADLIIHEGLYCLVCMIGHLFNAIVGDEKWLLTFLGLAGHILYLIGRIFLPNTTSERETRAAEGVGGESTAAEEQEETLSETTIAEEHEETILGESNISQPVV
ncbi:hypothetical protein BZL39_A08950 [Zygosaccharomyces parabailii]|nr:hypothetical protein BZL39_A08950 [Zygosaccharomyces parabailii]CDH16861.1 uncharacterized protein ZBAI_08649 [Zygosaccharomyces bailii ISA1307]